MNSKIFKQIADIVAKELNKDVSTIEPESELLIDLGADTLDVVEIIMDIEEHFGIHISEDEASEITSVKKCVNIVQSKVSES